VLGEAGGRFDQEPGRGRPGLISQELAEGDPGAVIDRLVDMAAAPAGRQHPPDLGSWQGMGAAVGSSAAVGQPGRGWW
jgi:hypothetical protein